MIYLREIQHYTLEFDEESHTYLVDGIIVPSVTQLLKEQFGHKYDGVPEEILKRASQRGTEVHEAIERYIKTGEETELPEMRGFKFLQKVYHFTPIESEVPVILFDKEPIAAGRLDLVLEMDGKIGGADIKRTAALDKEYLAYQLNLYRIAYKQSYGVEWQFLKGIHLRDDKRKMVDIPINEEKTMEFIKEIQR